MNCSLMRPARSTLHALLCSAVVACAAATEPDPVVEQGLRDAASVVIDSSGVRTLVVADTLTNVSGSDLATIWGNDCRGNSPMDVRMYRGNTLVWNSDAVPNMLGCPVVAIQSTLTPDQSFVFQWRATVKSILGDSLPPGPYTFTVLPSLATPTLTERVNAGGLVMADPIAVPPGTKLDGTWVGTFDGVTVSLSLAWAADSVRGTGTYQFTPVQSAGCYFASTSGSGTVSFQGSRVDDVVAGYLQFSSGYAPPYSGRLRSATELDGTIHNIDTPGCPLTLTRSP